MDFSVVETVFSPTSRNINNSRLSLMRQKRIVVDVKQQTRRGIAESLMCPKDFSLDVKPKPMTKGRKYPIVKKNDCAPIKFGNEIWYCIAKYIPPEDVGKFALICRQTANLLTTPQFWLQIYQRYYEQFIRENNSALSLPQELQPENIRNCDNITLRARVIQALFYCYGPFVERTKSVYSHKNLLGCTYLGSSHKYDGNLWITCHKFCNNWGISRRRQLEKLQERILDIDDWESLLDENVLDQQITTIGDHYKHEGVSLLIISSKHFIPFSTELISDYTEQRTKLYALRLFPKSKPKIKGQRTKSKARGKRNKKPQKANEEEKAQPTDQLEAPVGDELEVQTVDFICVEFDFINNVNKKITTVKYPIPCRCKALPWWHPYFCNFIN